MLVILESSAAFTDWLPYLILQLYIGALLICVSGFVLAVHGMSRHSCLLPFF